MADWHVKSSATGSGSGSSASPWTFAQALAAASGVAAGDRILAWADAPYTLSGAVTVGLSGSTGSGQITITGASASGVVDGTLPSVTQSTSGAALFDLSNINAYLKFQYLSATHSHATKGPFAKATGTAGHTNIKLHDVLATNFTYLFDGSSRVVNGLYCLRAAATGMTTGVIRNGSVAGSSNGADRIDGCYFVGNTGACYDCGNISTDLIVTGSVLAGNTRGVYDNGGSARVYRVSVSDSIIANNTSDGIGLASTSSVPILTLINSIVYGNGGWGVNLQGTAAANDARAGANRNNFFGSNTSGNRNNLSAGDGDVALTAGPFTNSGSGDYSPNTTAGGGALLRALGFPRTFPAGSTTGYRDGGAIQHQDSGGSSVPKIWTGGGKQQ